MILNLVSFISYVLGTLTIILAFMYIYFKCVTFNYWRKRGVICEKPIVPVGNFGQVLFGKLNPGELYMNLYEKLKKFRYFGSYALFNPKLVIADPDLIKIILIKEFMHFHDRNFYCNEDVDPLTGHLLLQSGQEWKNARMKLRPFFISGNIKMIFGLVKDVSDELYDLLKETAHEEKVVEIKDIFSRFTTDVIMNTAFGIRCNTLQNPNCEFRYWTKKIGASKLLRNMSFAFVPELLNFFRIRYIEKKVTEFFMSTFQEIIEQRMKSNSQRKFDFLDTLLPIIKYKYAEDEDGNIPRIAEHIDGKMSMKECCAQCFIFLLAGFETSSSAITFCLYELAINQDIQDKLRNEINTVLKKYNNDLTLESVNDMSYLHKVICETLRKYPSVMYLNRLCTKDIDLPTTNLHIEKGTDIVISILGLHRDPDIYPEPMKFDPERFNEKNIAARHPCAYLPFGKGPRNCIGMSIGLMQTKIAIIRTITSCYVTSAPETSVPFEFDPGTLFYNVKSGIYLQLKTV